ncbi:TetR/AcrR family transcriptional regulator C-terminal domain-containing protein [Rhodopseudomonas palustris]|nr:TetR/AcrR family transcriptional regulator C-terminal domain-containing protein [Rhodopseudomonas palustris]
MVPRAIDVRSRVAESMPAKKAGRLSAPDPMVAAHHLLSLLEPETSWRRLLQLESRITADEIAQTVRRGVDVFLSAYGAPKRSASSHK